MFLAYTCVVSFFLLLVLFTFVTALLDKLNRDIESNSALPHDPKHLKTNKNISRTLIVSSFANCSLFCKLILLVWFAGPAHSLFCSIFKLV